MSKDMLAFSFCQAWRESMDVGPLQALMVRIAGLIHAVQ